jgi:hypothetical protein
LLSEAEFEYAVRAGGSSRYGFGNDPGELCKFDNGADQSAKAASLPANAPYMNCRDGYLRSRSVRSRPTRLVFMT